MCNHNKQKGTEGILNKINERYGCNKKAKTIAVQQLIRFHKPKHAKELEALIDLHQEDKKLANCECGCKSKGTVESFAGNLYDAYLKYQAEVDNSVEYKDLNDCLVFMKHLFVFNSIKGNMMEEKVVKMLNEEFKNNDLYQVDFKMASELADFKHAIDISAVIDGEEVFGVQVKPLSYKHCSPDIKEQKRIKNQL